MRSGVRKALARRVLLADRRTPVRDREGRRPDDDPSLPAAGTLISQWKALLCGSSGRKSVDFMEAPERAPAARELHLRPPARIRFSLTNEGRDGCLSRSLSQKSLTGRWTGEQAPPPRPLQFSLKSIRFPGAKSAGKGLFLWKMGFSAGKSLPHPPYTPPGAIDL